MPCSSSPSPRVHIYKLPTHVAPPPPKWRYVQAITSWIENSPYNEPDGTCADYFFVPTHPDKYKEQSADDQTAIIFQYIRTTWPFWNHTVQQNIARHFWLLPCDHGPSDCAFTHPLRPNKFHRADVRPDYSQFATKYWQNDWEYINPASPVRLLFTLTFNGWSDGLRKLDGSCINCFQPGLDIRLPTPDHFHPCGPLCGLHKLHREVGLALLERDAIAVKGARRKVITSTDISKSGNRKCLISWAGAERDHQNYQRVVILQLLSHRGPRSCFRDTVREARVRENDTDLGMVEMMKTSRFCFSPRGWDQGDSDRYLPSILYGCIPVFVDKLEAMPLQELEDMKWNESALFVEVRDVVRLRDHIKEYISPNTEQRMRDAADSIWRRLLYTSMIFGQGPLNDSLCQLSKRGRISISQMKSQLQYFGFNITPTSLCARRNYLGESSQTDAIHGLMQVLARRLETEKNPSRREPWASNGLRPICRKNESSQQCKQVVRSWFGARSNYYWKKVGSGHPLRQIDFIPPFRGYWNEVRESKEESHLDN